MLDVLLDEFLARTSQEVQIFRYLIGIIWESFGRMERVKGIEPSSSAWKAVALPLSYTRGRIQGSYLRDRASGGPLLITRSPTPDSWLVGLPGYISNFVPRANSGNSRDVRAA